jgi:tetratricopeptide (TPR) repeat protein
VAVSFLFTMFPGGDPMLGVITDDPASWLSKGMVLYVDGDYQNALVCIDNALNLTPEDTYCQLVKGRILIELKDFKGAADCFEIIEKSNTVYTIPWLDFIATVAVSRDRDLALRCLDDFLKENPRNSDALAMKIHLLISECRYIDALNVLDRLTSFADESWFWTLYGDCHYLLEIYDEALYDYNRAIDKDPGNPLLWKRKGETLLQLNRLEEAQSCFFVEVELSLEQDLLV